MSEQSTVMRPDPFDPFSGARLAAAGFLARYSGRTREAYTEDLKGYLTWCANRQLDVFAVTRAHIEVYVRWLEEDRHLAPAFQTTGDQQTLNRQSRQEKKIVPPEPGRREMR